MKAAETGRVSFDAFDEINYPRPDRTDFDGVAERFLSRRAFLRGTAAVGATAFVLGAGGRIDGGFECAPWNRKILDEVAVDHDALAGPGRVDIRAPRDGDDFAS